MNDDFADSCSGHGACYENPTALYSYICTCDPGYTGDRCDMQINECDTLDSDTYDTCDTHGTCVDELNGYHCQCDDDFYGMCAVQIVYVCVFNEYLKCNSHGCAYG